MARIREPCHGIGGEAAPDGLAGPPGASNTHPRVRQTL
jgi:hypothetical protein